MLRRRACFTSWTVMVSFAMNDYHHFNRPGLLEDHFKEKDKRDPFQDLDEKPMPKEIKVVVAGMNMRNRLGIVEGYRLAFDKLETLSIATGKDWNDLVSEASQLSVETGISFVEAAEKGKEKYLNGL